MHSCTHNTISDTCIGDDTKVTARSLNCVRKQYVLWNAGICSTAGILWKPASLCKISLKSCNWLQSYGQQNDFQYSSCQPSWIKKI